MERPRCETCIYWEEIDPEILGECHRHAARPKMFGEIRKPGDNDAAIWPETAADDWCGEHPDFPAYIASLKAPATPDDSRDWQRYEGELDARCRTTLEILAITDMAEIAKLRPSKVLDVRNCGLVTLRTINAFLNKHGFKTDWFSTSHSGDPLS